MDKRCVDCRHWNEQKGEHCRIRNIAMSGRGGCYCFQYKPDHPNCRCVIDPMPEVTMEGTCEKCLHYKVASTVAPDRGACLRYPQMVRKLKQNTCGEFQSKLDAKRKTIGKPMYFRRHEVSEGHCGICKHFTSTNHLIGDCMVATTRTTEYDLMCDDFEPELETEHITE